MKIIDILRCCVISACFGGSIFAVACEGTNLQASDKNLVDTGVQTEVSDSNYLSSNFIAKSFYCATKLIQKYCRGTISGQQIQDPKW